MVEVSFRFRQSSDYTSGIICFQFRSLGSLLSSTQFWEWGPVIVIVNKVFREYWAPAEFKNPFEPLTESGKLFCTSFLLQI